MDLLSPFDVISGIFFLIFIDLNIKFFFKREKLQNWYENEL